MNNIVIIPIYKPTPEDTELRSLNQCLKILGRHDICLICPEGLDTSVYQDIFSSYHKELTVEYFDASFFKSVSGYNKLMLSESFYRRFIHKSYMLIYQLDAYVFRDDLDYWCAQGYDYIGAPWMKLNGEMDPINCGNGGFSLRNIPAFINLFSHEGKVLTFKGLCLFHRYRGPLHKPYYILTGLFGHKNKLKDFIDGERVNEDLFYASLKGKQKKSFKIPNTNIAMQFAFEEKPSLLYEKNGHLPFGCHAWMKYEYETFWKKHIN